VHEVVLGLQALLARPLGLSFATCLREIFEADDLRADESFLNV
jgi:hypothetical protein